MATDEDAITVTIRGHAAAELRRVAKVATLGTERALSTLASVALGRGLPAVEADLLASTKPKDKPFVFRPRKPRARVAANAEHNTDDDTDDDERPATEHQE